MICFGPQNWTCTITWEAQQTQSALSLWVGLLMKRRLLLRMFSSRWVIDPSTFSVPSDSSLWWIAATQKSELNLYCKRLWWTEILCNSVKSNLRNECWGGKRKNSGKRSTNVQSHETETFSISGTEGKTINRPYPSGRWEITSPISAHRCFYWTNAPLVPVPTQLRTWPCSTGDCTGSIHLSKAINSTDLWSWDIWSPLTWR